MAYSVKEVRYTLQGEGLHAGRPAVLCRLTGCNLWTGHEAQRPTAVCQLCDTDFVGTNGPGGDVFQSADDLAQAVREAWPEPNTTAVRPFVVLTGGEPLLQVDEQCITALHQRGFEVALETNGTIALPAGIDWLCVSPKAGTRLILRKGDELKLVYPQPGAEPELFTELDFRYFYLQPLCGPDTARNTELAVRYCQTHPRWRLSVQLHKILGLP